MVGLGGANAGELVVGGRGIAFICLEHFTGRVNPETYGMGLPPDLIPLWIGHELAHTVRYTSATSGSDMRRLVAEAGGYYDYWSTGSRASLRELLVNEGLAVHAAQAVAPGFDAADYFGYPRRQYHRLREMEAFLRRVVEPDLEQSGLGLRLRYLSGGMSPTARLVGGRVIAGARGILPGVSDDAKRWWRNGGWRPRCGRRRWSSRRRKTSPGGSRRRRATRESRLLPHAEAGEHPIEDLLDVDRPDELVEGGRRFPDVVRHQHGVARAAELRRARRPAPPARARAPCGAARG